MLAEMGPEMTELTTLDRRVAELAERYRPLAVAILKEAIRIPADQVDLPVDSGGDPRSGLSNHEGSRLRFLLDTIVDVGAVLHADDVGFDDYGNLVWTVTNAFDEMSPDHKRVIYFDGHSDTVQALRDQWRDKLKGAVDPYDGLVDGAAVDPSSLRAELGYLPPDDELHHLVFGRGSADQLAGVVAQIVATKILLELRDEGALRGCIVRAYATAAEEDNDGGGPRHLVDHVLPGAAPELIPDVVVLTEGTGDAVKGALGIYRGQRGRMQIEVTVTGRSCHGSMPALGLNPLEHGGAILAEAAVRHANGEGMLDHPFIGRGTRTASWATLDTPSDCAVPECFTFRFDRRLTVGETPQQALAEIESLDAVAAARLAGLTVEIVVPPQANALAAASETGVWSPRSWWSLPEVPLPGPCAAPPGSTSGSSPPTGSASRSRSTARRSACPRASSGWCPVRSATRRCSASVPASSRTRTASASASTNASCSTPSPCWPASREHSRI